jgi:hypothetical protein
MKYGDIVRLKKYKREVAVLVGGYDIRFTGLDERNCLIKFLKPTAFYNSFTIISKDDRDHYLGWKDQGGGTFQSIESTCELGCSYAWEKADAIEVIEDDRKIITIPIVEYRIKTEIGL